MIQSLRGLLSSYSNHCRLLTLGAAHTWHITVDGGALIVTQNMFMQSSNLSMYLLAKIIIQTQYYVILSCKKKKNMRQTIIQIISTSNKI